MKRKTEEEMTVEKSLVPLEKYLEAGVHIGSKYKSGQMRKFIYKIRNDGLCILNINELNKRLKIAAKFLSHYEPSDILVVAGRSYSQKPAKVFAETIGAKYIIGRFVPGTLTNPENENFIEPKILFTSDPPVDKQAIKEAVKAKIPVISLCDTSNLTKNIDLVIPCNNKGKKAIALIYWIIAREYLKERGIIESDKQFEKTPSDFETKITKQLNTNNNTREEKGFQRRQKKPMTRRS